MADRRRPFASVHKVEHSGLKNKNGTMRPASQRYIRFTLGDDQLPAPRDAPVLVRARPGCGQRCNRCLRFTGFCLVCTGTLFQAVAPWVLSVFEALSIVLLALLLVPHPHGRPPSLGFDFRHDLGDIVVASVLRAAVISLTYAYGTRRQFLRPYLYTAYAAGSAGLVYAVVKAANFDYGPRAAWAARGSVLALFGAFSLVHVLAARNVVAWARRRTALGLATFPWEPGLREGLLPRQRRSVGGGGSSDYGSDSGGGGRGDVPPELLADPDSNFTPVGELWVHWKEALPPTVPAPLAAEQLVLAQKQQQQQHQGNGSGTQFQQQQQQQQLGPSGEETAVVLIHSGGGGVFAWRHIMGDLAARTGLRVIAFDRPGFGLTSRPPAPPSGSAALNPYTPASQALLVLQLCSALGVQRAVLAGHGDGALIAAMAVAVARKHRGLLPSGSGASGPPVRALSIPSGPTPATGSTPDLVWASSLASSDADIFATLGRTGLAELWRQEHGAQAASGSLGSGRQGSVGRLGRSAPSSGRVSESRSMANSLSFQSLLVSIDSDEQQTAMRPGKRPPGQQQQQTVEEQSEEASSPQQDWASSGAATGAGQSADDGDDTAGSESRGVAAAVDEPPALQAMSSAPNGSGDHLAPQLWPRAGALQAPAEQQQHQQQQDPRDSYIVIGAHSPASDGCDLEIAGVALLHPKLSGHTVGGFTRLLARAKLGRAMLRPLLRSEIGEVSNRRAWHRGDRCTRQVLDLYRRPLRVEGWDAALIASAVAANGLTRRAVARDLATLRGLPVLVATGAFDRLSTPVNAGRLAATVGARMGMVPSCGHLSHEEAPQALLELLVPFVCEAVAVSGTAAGDGGGGSSSGHWDVPRAESRELASSLDQSVGS